MKVSDLLERLSASGSGRGISSLVASILEGLGIEPESDASTIDERVLEALVRGLVERGVKGKEGAAVMRVLKSALEEAGSPTARKLRPRVKPELIPAEIRRKSFEEVVKGVGLEEAAREARRCLTCRNPRCVKACPINYSVPAFLKAVADGRIDAAYRLSLMFTPLLGVCGRICVGFCEKACILGQVGLEPVAIRLVKRALADTVDKARLLPKPKEKTGMRIAVVGSGPAGLTAAYHLALMGHSVTIFEAADSPGGMLGQALPEFRLPRKVIEEEVELLRKLDVEFRLGCRIGDDLALSDLLKGHQAVFISVGAHKSNVPKMPGLELEGVLDALRFLKDVKRGEFDKLGGKVWVIGGGNVAVDAARTALRLGAEEVRIMYRRGRREMPAGDEEVEAALEEGVEIVFLAAPVEVLGKDGKVAGIRCVRMRLGEPGPDGRRRPEPVPGSEFTVDADYVIFATGERPETGWIKPEDGVELTRWGTIKVDENLATTREGVYAGGDAVRGPSTFVEASADGLKAARAINRYLLKLKNED